MAILNQTAPTRNTNVGHRTDEGRTLFPVQNLKPGRNPRLSNIITVTEDCMSIKTFNLAADVRILIEQACGDLNGELFAPYSPLGYQEALCCKRQTLLICIPGRYRLVFMGTMGNAKVIHENAGINQQNYMPISDPCPPL